MMRTAAMKRRHRGMSLIEVLVSLVILSLGVLAVVALQLVSTRNNADAGQRSIASQLAYSLLERMRSNATSVSLVNYLTGSKPLGRGSMGATISPMCTGTTVCGAVDLSNYDMWSWEQSLDGTDVQSPGFTGAGGSGGLVQPTACVDGPSSGGPGVYTVTIVWRGTVQLADRATIPCGRDPQANGTNLYSLSGSDNLYRRVLQVSVYITTRPNPSGP